MAEAEPRAACRECGEPLEVFRPTCENCGAEFDWTALVECEECGSHVEASTDTCPECGADVSIWRAIERDIAETGSPAAIWKDAVPRPSRDGYSRHLGSLKGQWADYRRVTEDGTEFHVLEFTDHYEIHRDEVSAMDHPGMHLVRYTPRIVVATAGGVTLGMLDTVVYSSKLVTDAMQASLSLFPERDEDE